MNIVLIEDEPDCYENYQVFLEVHGHKVTLYDEADPVIKDMDMICRADVIILDLMIQLGTKIDPSEASETGTALYKRIRKVAADVPIVILTARSRSDIWHDFQNDKHIKYLGKPVGDLEEFYKTIENWS